MEFSTNWPYLTNSTKYTACTARLWFSWVESEKFYFIKNTSRILQKPEIIILIAPDNLFSSESEIMSCFSVESWVVFPYVKNNGVWVKEQKWKKSERKRNAIFLATFFTVNVLTRFFAAFLTHLHLLFVRFPFVFSVFVCFLYHLSTLYSVFSFFVENLFRSFCDSFIHLELFRKSWWAKSMRS